MYQIEEKLKAEFTDDAVIFHWQVRQKMIDLKSISGYCAYPFLPGKISLIIAYKDGEKSRFLDILMDSEAAGPFLERFQSSTPSSANLLHLDKDQALKALGRKDPGKGAFWAVMFLTAIILVAIHLPALWHGFADRELSHTSIDAIHAGELPATDYVAFAAVTGEQALVVREFENLWTTRTKKGYFPLLPGHWQNGDAIRAVLVVDGPYLDEMLRQHGKMVDSIGIVRNILWETVPSERAVQLARKTGSPVEQPVFIDFRANPGRELLFALFTILALQSLVAFITFRLLRWRK